MSNAMKVPKVDPKELVESSIFVPKIFIKTIPTSQLLEMTELKIYFLFGNKLHNPP